MPPLPQGLQPISVRVFKADVAVLKRVYGDSGVSEALRAIISQHCTMLRTNLENPSSQGDGQ